MLDVLTRNGQGEAAFRVATQKSYPGWGYMIAEGATTLWERWEKLGGHAMNSQNHIMLGSVDAWFYRVLAGLSPALPGWKKVRIRPHVLGDLTFVEASLETVAGRIGSAWKRAGDVFSLEVRVPVGADRRSPRSPARPGRPRSRIRESRRGGRATRSIPSPGSSSPATTAGASSSRSEAALTLRVAAGRLSPAPRPHQTHQNRYFLKSRAASP
ncbi:MAG: hypothetical protein M0C28_27885 [Candidatus Moduliflexus flocculans]|nr:hypothetical protein [Candidatus Moduliflexus flocculans]